MNKWGLDFQQQDKQIDAEIFKKDPLTHFATTDQTHPGKAFTSG